MGAATFMGLLMKASVLEMRGFNGRRCMGMTCGTSQRHDGG